MLYKIFYSLLMGMSPWTASLSLPSASKAPQQVVERPSEENQIAVKEFAVKEAVRKWARSDEDVFRQVDLFCQSLKSAVDSRLMTAKDAESILGAAIYAMEKHKSQVRSNPKKTPYIIHPIEVADLVVKVGKVYDKDVLITALLHDVMDDTAVTFEEIGSLYGSGVVGYLNEMAIKKDLSLKEQKKQQIMQAFHQTPNVAIIKMSDKLSNLKTLATTPPASWSRDKIDQYFQWAQAVVENLPESNSMLKTAVKATISDYWEKQAQYKKS